jgi:FdhD protein
MNHYLQKKPNIIAMPDNNRAPSAIAKVKVQKSDSENTTSDNVVVEEPLEIRLKRGDVEEQLGITMRTPGSDLELAAGFLWGEGFLTSPDQLMEVKVCGDRTLSPRQRANVVIAEVSMDVPTSHRNLDRRFTITSACGVCGSTSISDLHQRGIPKVFKTTKPLPELAALPELLIGNQQVFSKTGGLHAAVLVNREGKALYLREDVGRHNAVDKVIGAALMAGHIPLSNWTLVVSGRVGYEIVQKAICAGISALVGVSAPTSLAVELADEFDLTLLAFARNNVAKHFISVIVSE